MKTAVVLQHVDMEGPGEIAPACRDADVSLAIVRLFAGEPVPAALAPDTGLIVMGGGMGVGDRDDPRFPFLCPEIDLLRLALRQGNPILGVCLGAQLLAHAAGARVFPNVGPDASGQSMVPVREVGWGPVTLHGVGGEPALRGLEPEMMVLHWHGDTFALPAGAILLASTPACRHQAFRIGPRVFGLQFHVEADADTARRWAREDTDFVLAARGAGGASEIDAETTRHAERARRAGDRMIRNIVGCMRDA